VSRLTILEVAKTARGVEPGQREELLLTGLLGWAFERSPDLLRRVLRRAESLDRDPSRSISVPSEVEFDVTREPSVISDEGEHGRFDLRIEWDTFLVVIESKVVRLGTEGGLTVGQLKKYHLSIPKEMRGSYGVVALTPDTIEQLRKGLRSLEAGQGKTHLLSWISVHEESEAMERDGAASPVDRLVAGEIRQAIEMVPDLKPFRGFDDDEVAALRQIPKAFERVEQLFKAVYGHLSTLGLELEDKPRGKGEHYYDASRWHAYYDRGFRLLSGEGKASDVYYGPWLRPTEGCYSVYLETEGAAQTAFSLLTKGPTFRGGLQKRFFERFCEKLPAKGMPWFDVRRVAVDVPLGSDLLKSKAMELPRLSAEVIQFFHDEVAARLAG